MNRNDKPKAAWLAEVNRQLDKYTDQVDEVTAKRLQKVRERALKHPQKSWLQSRWRQGALAALLVVAITPLAWHMNHSVQQQKMEPELLGATLSAEDLDDLDLLMGLEDVGS